MSTKADARSEFKGAVFARDHQRCVACGCPAVDAHHIMQRKLFPDGGYLLDNGVSLCSGCHVLAESSQISCADLRVLAGIKEVVLPPGFDPGFAYDLRGEPIDFA